MVEVPVPGGSAIGGRSNHGRRTTPQNSYCRGPPRKAEKRAGSGKNKKQVSTGVWYLGGEAPSPVTLSLISLVPTDGEWRPVTLPLISCHHRHKHQHTYTLTISRDREEWAKKGTERGHFTGAPKKLVSNALAAHPRIHIILKSFLSRPLFLSKKTPSIDHLHHVLSAAVAIS